MDHTPLDPDRLRPWSAMEARAPRPEAQAVAAEPIVNLPAAPAALAAATLAAFALQSATGVEAQALRFGFIPDALARARGWSRLISVLFVHGSWTHVVMNCLGLVAFGAPVARLFGRGAGGAAAFLVFYFLCGALSALGYAAVHPQAGVLMVGASGAVSGLMGAASRLIGLPPVDGPVGRLAPFLSRPVIGMAAAWTVVNVLIAVSGVSPGAGTAPVAWEAHLFGYAAGLLLAWPAARVLGRVRA